MFDVYAVLKDNHQHTWTAYSLQLMAGVSAFLAAISGNMAETLIINQKSLHLVVAESFDSHISMGNATVWLIVLVIVGRSYAILEKKKWAFNSWVFPIVSVALALLILNTGLLGGALSQDILEFFIAN